MTFRHVHHALNGLDHPWMIQLARNSKVDREIQASEARDVDPWNRKHLLKIIDALLPLDLDHQERIRVDTLDEILRSDLGSL